MRVLEVTRRLLAILPAGKEPVAEIYAAGKKLLPEQEKYLLEVCARYEFTLSMLGIKLPTPPLELPPEPHFVDYQQGKFLLRLSDAHAEHIHMVPKARFDRGDGIYVVPYRLYPVLRLHAFIKHTEIFCTNATRQAVLDMYAEMRARYKASMAHDAELDMGGFGLALDPYQRAGIKGALRFKRGFLADEMGLGKTRQALGVIWMAKAYPALVVCPASVPINWQKEATAGLVGLNVYRCRSKNAPVHACTRSQISIFTRQQADLNCDGCRFDTADLVIVNFDKLPDGWKCQYDEEGRKIKGRKRQKGERAEVQLSGLGDALRLRGFRAVIIDESYYIKNEASQRTKAVQELIGKPDIRLALSGTPIKSRPSEIIPQLKVLDRLDDVGGEEIFYRRFCGNSSTGDTKGASEETELNKLLRGCGFIQRNKRDIRKELPPVRECKIWVEIDNREEYIRVETDLINWCAEQAVLKEEFLKYLSKLDLSDQEDAKERKMIETRLRIMRAAALIRVGALRRVAFKGKVNAAIEWIQEFLQSEKKLVAFAELRATQYAIQERFNALHIFGKDKLEDRVHHEEIFMGQRGNDLGLNQQIIMCSNGAAREGINLDAGDDILLIERPWTPAEERQIVARIDRHRVHNINAWKIIAEDTIEAKIDTILDEKGRIVDAVTKGESTEGIDKSSLIDSLVSELATMSTDPTSREAAHAKFADMLARPELYSLPADGGQVNDESEEEVAEEAV